jgi:hypothetical protein
MYTSEPKRGVSGEIIAINDVELRVNILLAPRYDGTFSGFRKTTYRNECPAETVLLQQRSRRIETEAATCTPCWIRVDATDRRFCVHLYALSGDLNSSGVRCVIFAKPGSSRLVSRHFFAAFNNA